MAVLTEIERAQLLPNVRARGEQLRAALRAIGAKPGSAVLEVRGWGLIVGAQLSEAGATAAQVCAAAAKEGLLLVPAGPHVVRFVPPLIVSEAEVTEAAAIFERALAAVAAPPAHA